MDKVFKLLGSHSNSERQKEDYYATDPAALEALLEKESFDCMASFGLKWSSHLLAKEVKKLDVSAMQAQFVIAKCCLEDNTAKIYELLSKTYPDSFDAVSIRDWPIFINFRETEEYKSFLKEHKNDFAIQEMTVDNNEFVLMNDA